MRLIIPVEFYVKGGVERVIISLVENLVNYVEKIILILPKKELVYFQNILPKSDVIIYESFTWPAESFESRILAVLNKVLGWSEKLNLGSIKKVISAQIDQVRTESRIKSLINKYQATHCLYVMMNRLKVPNISIPLAGISYDLFWRFSPLTYPDSYIENYDRSLLEWLAKADLILTISEKTQNDIISVFSHPEFVAKIKAVPLAGFPNNQAEITVNTSESQCPIFYFPSSFGIYKDHLTFLKAGVKLAEKNINFKIVLIGKETDSLIKGKLQLSRQSQTEEYMAYLNECQQLYREHQGIFEKYFQGLGYCDYEQVEECYQTCACVVVPSTYEGFGLAVAEAIVRGLPVIAADLDVFKEQIKIYNCPDRVELFAQGDVDALVSCMEKFILSPKRKLMPEEIKERFSHWTWQDVAKEYVAQLDSVKK